MVRKKSVSISLVNSFSNLFKCKNSEVLKLFVHTLNVEIIEHTLSFGILYSWRRLLVLSSNSADPFLHLLRSLLQQVAVFVLLGNERGVCATIFLFYILPILFRTGSVTNEELVIHHVFDCDAKVRLLFEDLLHKWARCPIKVLVPGVADVSLENLLLNLHWVTHIIKRQVPKDP